jgi:hypothetical protein
MEKANRYVPHDPLNEPRDISDVRRLARELDSKFEVLGIRVGWDGVLGLFPGIGDLVTNAMSFYILFRAADLGCPPSVLLRMGFNIFVDNLFDAIPILGNVFDVFYRSNLKNLALIERYAQDPHRTARTSRAVVFGLLFVFALLMIAMVGFAVWGVIKLFQYLGDGGTVVI